MEVILKQDVQNLGNRDDIVSLAGKELLRHILAPGPELQTVLKFVLKEIVHPLQRIFVHIVHKWLEVFFHYLIPEIGMEPGRGLGADGTGAVLHQQSLIVAERGLVKNAVYEFSILRPGDYVIVHPEPYSFFRTFGGKFIPDFPPLRGHHSRGASAHASARPVPGGIQFHLNVGMCVIVTDVQAISGGIRQNVKLFLEPLHIQRVTCPPVERHIAVTFRRIEEALLQIRYVIVPRPSLECLGLGIGRRRGKQQSRHPRQKIDRQPFHIISLSVKDLFQGMCCIPERNRALSRTVK